MTQRPEDQEQRPSVRFDIRAKPADAHAWEEQLNLIRASGAQFDPETRNWYLWLDPEALPTRSLDLLFQVARLYGATVQVGKVQTADVFASLALPSTLMSHETRIALMNYDWMVRNRGLDDVQLAWESDTLVYGDGGAVIDTLAEPGFTPATRFDE